jgi:hypothetical protein
MIGLHRRSMCCEVFFFFFWTVTTIYISSSHITKQSFKEGRIINMYIDRNSTGTTTAVTKKSSSVVRRRGAIYRCLHPNGGTAPCVGVADEDHTGQLIKRVDSGRRRQGMRLDVDSRV